jgi:aryl-alcohol dehydrogenase-like predicted oxidoreductase
MRQVVLPATDLKVSRFSFGTAALHLAGDSRRQAALLRAARASGFTHFDTAPLYGFGLAETMIGSVIGQDAGVSIATKVGLYPPGGRARSRLLVLARKSAGRILPVFSKAVANLNIGRARRSLDQSLKALRRDRIDILFLHDADPRLLMSDEFETWRGTEIDRVGHFGLAGIHSDATGLAQTHPGLTQVLQARDSLDGREADAILAMGRPLQFTFGYLSSTKGGASPEAILGAALKRNPAGSILVSTRSHARVGQYASILDKFEKRE